MKRIISLPIICTCLISACTTLRITQVPSYIETSNGLEIEMMGVKGGDFLMGCHGDTSECSDDEGPLHRVSLMDFHISKYEISNELYCLFCDTTGRDKPMDAEFRHEHTPAIYVSWDDAVAFCRWLSRTTGKNYRLPTEAEWEYAARGGLKSKSYRYAGSNKVSKVAWYDANDDINDLDSTTPKGLQRVGKKKANKLGIHDMSGNAWEWCLDNYSADFYEQSPSEQPLNIQTAASKVVRGGGWYNTAAYCRISSRDHEHPNVKDNDLGFRVVMTTDTTEHIEQQTLALEKRGAHYFMDTHINGVETVIMLESGIPALLLDMPFYTSNIAAFNCDFEPSDEKIRLMNKLHDIVLKADINVKIGNIDYEGPVFILSGSTPPAIPIQHFKSQEDGSSIIKVDLQEGVLQILSREELNKYKKDSLTSYPLQFNKMGMPVIQSSIDISLQGKTVRLEDDFILDYGNGVHLFLLKGNQSVQGMINENALQLSEAKNKAGDVIAEGLLFESMTLMGTHYKDVSVGVTDKMRFNGEAGLIGLKSLQRCLIFDIENKELHVLK